MRTLLLILLPTAALAQPAPAERDEARMVLEARCGKCHIGPYPTAIPGALKVFDLAEQEWAARLTDLQRKDIVARLRDPQGMDESSPGPPTAADLATVERYLLR